MVSRIMASSSSSCGIIQHPISFPYRFPHPHPHNIHSNNALDGNNSPPASPNLHPADPAAELGASTIHLDKDRLTLELDVISFSPEEVAVSSLDGVLILKGGPAWHANACREFTRKFRLPEGCDVDSMMCKIGSEGTLIVSVPLKMTEMKRKLRPVMKKHQVHCHEVAHGRLVPNQIWVNGVECTKHKFVVRLNLPKFTPAEVTVRTVDDFLVVEGYHEDKSPDGKKMIMSSSFHYRYLLPFNADKNEVQSEMDARGELLLTVPRTCGDD